MNKDLEKWLRCEISKRGWSDTDFANKINIGQGNLSSMFSGKRGLPLNFFTETAKLLDVSTDWLFQLAGMLPQRWLGDKFSDIYNGLTPDKKQEVIDFAEFLLQKQIQGKS
jgi:hypothetical protein